MKFFRTAGLMFCLLAASLYGQRELPGLEDPAFESISTKYRVEYHYNKTSYTLYKPDINSPIVFKCKFKFFTTQRTTTTIGKVKRQVVKRKFDLTNVMNDEMYKVDTVVGETEIYDFFYIPDKSNIAIVIKDDTNTKNLGIFYPNGENPEKIFKGILKGESYTFTDKSKERFGFLADILADEIMLRKCRKIEKDGDVIAQYIKGRMRGSKIPFDLYIKNGMSEKDIANMMTIFICSHQLMLAFEDRDDTPHSAVGLTR